MEAGRKEDKLLDGSHEREVLGLGSKLKQRGVCVCVSRGACVDRGGKGHISEEKRIPSGGEERPKAWETQQPSSLPG